MIETAARGVQFFLAIGIAYVVALWFALVAWTFRDIESRSRSVFTQVFSTLLVVLFFVPGLLLYLILRPKETLDQAFQRALEEEYLLQDLDELPLCPGCQRTVDPEFRLCPHCLTAIRGPCAACARLIDLRWGVCPYCAVPVEREALSATSSTDDGVRVLDEARVGRRRRAVAAAAQRVGIAPEELDALTDALSGTANHAAVGAGNATVSLSRRIASIGDLSKFRPGPREPLEQAETSSGTVTADGDTSGNGSTTSKTTDGFWADPLPGSTPGGTGKRRAPS